MKRFMIVLTLIAGAALGAGLQISAQETQATTRPSPGVSDFTTAASMGLVNTADFRVMVCTADTTDMPQAVGTLNAYLLDERTSRVSRNKLLDLDMTQQVQPAHTQCINFPDQQVGVAADRVIYAANSLKLRDGGTLLTQSDGGLDAGAFIIYYRGWSVVR